MARFQRSTAGTSVREVEDWRDDAACRGVYDLFTAPDEERGVARAVREAAAKDICWECPVRQECTDEGLAIRDTWSIRGGLTPEERGLLIRREAKRRRVAAG